MQLIPQYNDLKTYLESSEIIDFGYQISREVTDLSYNITTYSKDEIDYIKNAYEYVRDNIAHSVHTKGNIVTCSASEVLQAKEGICFSKSHLLAAILRCNLIPTGFCYQRITLNDELVLHGLNVVYIEPLKKWVRVDAFGNKHGVNAQFSLDDEKLAFPVRTDKGEEDIPIVFASPDKNVIAALKINKNFNSLWANLPTKLYTAV